MLEQVDLSTKLAKADYKARYKELITRLVVLQQRAHQAGVGLVALFEGWDGAGKGSRISDLMCNLDARHTSVHVLSRDRMAAAEEFSARRGGAAAPFPIMKEFWDALGMRGDLTIYDRGWYTAAANAVMKSDASPEVVRERLESIGAFERQLAADGYVVVKFFIHISAKEQRHRLMKLAADESTSWRVSKEELTRLPHYDRIYAAYDRMLCATDFPYAPWTLVNGEDKCTANLAIAQTLVDALEAALAVEDDPDAEAAANKAAANSAGLLAGTDPRSRSAEETAQVEELARAEAQEQSAHAPAGSRFSMSAEQPTLVGVRHDLTMDEDEYRRALKREQKRFAKLQVRAYLKGIPLMLVYEGDDAAGKGGNIKRVAQAIDARSYTVFPSPAPTRPELLHPHLWRYWTRLPVAGHVGIYDRSWYGRVLVERVEGFASPAQWARAYDEINEFEEELVRWGALLIKFWVSVSSEEQLARFEARESDPAKQWKITPEDWRNRDKHPQYSAAVEDMFRLTSTEAAPWIILESDDKRYARVKALEIINKALEERLEQ